MSASLGLESAELDNHDELPGVSRQGPPEGAWRTLLRGISLSPELRIGLPGTLALALIAAAGRAIVPVAIQRTIDDGLGGAAGGIDLTAVWQVVALAGAAVLITALASGWMNYRLAAVVETALASLRVRAFRHIHDLSMLHQATQQRGSLVSRVTSDVDEISRFMQWAGLNLITAVGQLTVATVVMFVYSWRLTLVVLLVFLPFVLAARWFQKQLTIAYLEVREQVGSMLGALAETVVGAAVVRAFGIERRTQARLDARIEKHRKAAVHAGSLSSGFSGLGEVFAGLATAAAVLAGVWLGIGGHVSAGTVVAFLFLIALFAEPVQIAAEVINEAQTAIAGWRRVLDVLDVEPDVADPGAAGVDLPAGPISIEFAAVTFQYPRVASNDTTSVDDPGGGGADEDASGGRDAGGDGVGGDASGGRDAGGDGPGGDGPGGDGPGGDGAVSHGEEYHPFVLQDLSLTIPAQAHVAVVGETGSGKTTFAKLLTRLMDPTDGQVLLGAVPLETIRFSSLRQRVVMVPQDGTLFDGTIAENIRMGRSGASDAELQRAIDELGLTDWVDDLPAHLATEVGERGGSLSAGERQLVALARAYLANPDLLVLDEATSSVDPATEVRLQRALAGLARGRTTVTIAHRLSTAEAADDVLVFDQGEVVQRGHHDDLIAQGGIYGRLHASWVRGVR